MKHLIFAFVLLGAVLITTSCNNPLNKEYNEANLEKDLKEIVESKKVDTADLGYMAMYMMGAKLKGEKLEGKTYNDILAGAKEMRVQAEKQEAEAKALAEKAAKEKAEKSARMNQVLTVALFDKGFYKADWQEYITYDVAYENKSGKEIRAVKGSILITDLFDTKLKEIELVEDDGIPATGTVKKTYTTEYNQFRDEDVRIKGKEAKDIKAVWTAEKIIFADGTTLE